MMVTARWPGSNAEALYQALKRDGHSLWPVQEGLHFPERWQSLPLKIIRRAFQPLMTRDLHNSILGRAAYFRPHLFLAFKGTFVQPATLRELSRHGAKKINWYPDVSFTVHSRYLPRALPLYDWVFTAKTFGLNDMKKTLGVENASLLLHGYDPEVHAPQELTQEDNAQYGSDASFIGTWSPKKQQYLEEVISQMPDLDLKIWGNQWEKALPGALGGAIQGHEIAGREYAKAITASKINIAILSEKRAGASSGDHVTSRTFHIPASGGFMLHERTHELLELYDEGREIGCFESPEELARQIKTLLDDEEKRLAIARRGRGRCVPAHSMDARAQVILDKYGEMI